ncbi:M28 family peptidase [Robertkochia solimangrovi]|uniref:M28 family peptidase n=1 Tax=Robertkochia solimangrovi TaxID=2213046 RepID=UPI00117F07AC|nr:M28 family peptidase [Robertkochia solimangrovi]TRZ46416.1 peptidase M28 [Robertkochia solimangrovi]
MRNIYVFLTAIFMIAAILWRYQTMTPSYSPTDTDFSSTTFNLDNALKHVAFMAKQPHYPGTESHTAVRDYIVQTLKDAGLSPEVQSGYTGGDWGNLSKAENVVARIPGKNPGSALMLMSHYDSNPHSALGASDAASGVAVILEATRSIMASEEQPENDIIILITDGEELGLNGAQLFVDKSPLKKEVGLILNFEARGSGGPSYTLLETNSGNEKLIKAFAAAGVKYPVANSLFYSIYKILPNDTDLTVFREDADINGFNFAFIGDHFDYHTAMDNYDRMDRRSIAHQASYLVPLMNYFSKHPLKLKSQEDLVYFDFPFAGLIYYPFEWNLPLFILLCFSFIGVIFYGFKKGRINGKGTGKGFQYFLFALVLNGAIGYFSWPALKSVYPAYQDILHGFTYNGYWYIATLVALNTALCFMIYRKADKEEIPSLLIAPILFWILLSGAMVFYLEGASFFMIPVFFIILCMTILIRQKLPSPILMLLLCLPALWIFTPFIKMFPVGLGLKMLVSSSLFTVLLFGLLLPVTMAFKAKRALGISGFLAFLICFFIAHAKSDFTPERPFPNSLIFLQDTDQNKAWWATYNTYEDSWVSNYVDQSLTNEDSDVSDFSSKYKTSLSYMTATETKDIPQTGIQTLKDTIIGEVRTLELCVIPHRNVNRLEVITDSKNISACTVNGVRYNADYLKFRGSRLFTHFISDNATTTIEISFPSSEHPELQFYEASFDLLTNPLFTVPPRPENTIPMPFVLNDAIILKKTLQL